MQICKQITFRLADERDLDKIIEIWKGGWKKVHPTKLISEDQMIQFKKNFNNRNFPFNFWVVKSENEIVGWVSILPAFYHPMKARSEAEISIYIDRKKSNNGFGTMITSHVLKEIENSEINTVWAFVSLHNVQSKNMCKNAGMKICGMTSNKFLFIKEFN